MAVFQPSPDQLDHWLPQAGAADLLHLEEQIKGSSITQLGHYPPVTFFQWLLDLGCWSRMSLKPYYSSSVGKALLTQDCDLMCYCANPLLLLF